MDSGLGPCGPPRNDIGNSHLRVIPRFANSFRQKALTSFSTWLLGQISCSRLVPKGGRVASVFEMWSGMRVAATMPRPGCRGSENTVNADGGRRRQHGRTVQVHVRATARTNGVTSAPVTPLGHGASREIHPRAERRRRTASEARFSPAMGWTTCPRAGDG